MRASMRYPATSSPRARSATGRLYRPVASLSRRPAAPGRRPRRRSADRLPVDDRAEGLFFAFAPDAGEFALAAVGEVDRNQLLAFVRFDHRRDAGAVGAEDRVGLRPVGQFGDLLGALRADLLYPEAAVAAEDQRVALRRDVFDVGRADAFDQRLHLGAVLLHRVDVGVTGRPFGLVSTAEDDAAGEVARVELVDAAGGGEAGDAGAVGTDRVEVGVLTAAGRFGGADEDDRLAVGGEARFARFFGAGSEVLGRAAAHGHRGEVGR